MLVSAAALLALLVASTPESASAYVVAPSRPHSVISTSTTRPASSAAFAVRPFGAVSSPPTRRSGVLSLASSKDEDGFPADASENGPGRRKRAMAKARTFGQLLRERMDTMDAAFGVGADDVEGHAVEDISGAAAAGRSSSHRPSLNGDDVKGLVPMQAGVVKTGIQIAIAFWLFKKIKKMVGGKGKSAEDDGVTKTKEQDDALHAWTCNNCGATLFVARGKEFRYFRKDYKCYVCGNSGRENFTNTRGDIIERTGDDFEGTQYWEGLSKREQRKWMKEAFGDETIAKKMATDQWRKDNGIELEPAPAEVVAQVEEAVGEAGGEGDILDEVSEEASGGEEAAAAAAEDTSVDDSAEAEETSAAAADDDDNEAPSPAPTPAVSAPAPAPAPAPKPKPAPKPAPAPPKPTPTFDDDLDIFDELDDL